MENKNILVIGAGASGLMAARELAKANFKVTVLEARDRMGGRIFTIQDSTFNSPIELGAEFVHGNLPVTLHLLKEARIHYDHMRGQMIQVKNDQFEKEESYF